MQNLGGTRSSQQPSHLLLTADTFVRAPLPGEYAPGVASVVDLGRVRQGVKESPETILAALPSRRRRA